ncbi:MAG: apolipoprotein N-acyltransferase [Bacteroidetes bacterium HGW-Bacteroidetes-17]|jgi:apolipoprotein N-acyltransferase|nr:MAG: apolipoprotein N-acyltransferase [Bacteroidetes bacterium HGW-Bacteroidetes-17]
MKRIHLLALSILSGIIIALGWPLNGFPVLLFIGFVPLLYVEDYFTKHRADYSRYNVLLYSYLAFFVLNLLTNYWIWNSTVAGGIGALFLNSFFMTVPFTAYHFSRRVLYKYHKGHFLLLFYWMAFEYFHLDWDLSYPWLNLGNGFANWHKWIQWYEYTGALGGTFWILLINILIYRFIANYLENKELKPKNYVQLASILLIIIVPIIISLNIYSNYTETENPIDVVVVQPNLDPYSEQYGLDPNIVINRMLKIAGPKMDSAVDFMVFPESANQELIFEHNLEYYSTIRKLKNYLHDYPNTYMVVGASTFKIINGIDTLKQAARKLANGGGFYFAFNTGIFLNASEDYQLYHKSKLTPGVEMMPSWRILRPLEKFAIDLGGTIGTLATDDLRKNFITKDSVKTATAICYESIYGEFVSQFVRNGAQVIFIITNDGWWGNTAGHRQHFAYAKIRAIENRRSIARSANTGISAFINQRGDVSQQTKYWEPAVIRQKINLNKELTFYVKNGDYLARISSLITAFFILITISMALRNRKKSLKSVRS